MNHSVVSKEEWIKASQELLVKEKEITRARDEVSRLRRELPWVLVDKEYTFDTPSGKKTLSELFEGRSQLMVYHFMYAPGWEEGCSGCSFIADHFDAALPHLNHHDVTLVAVSRAPLADFQAFQKRMGWKFPWYSSNGSDFNFDYGASFRRGDLDAGDVFYNFKTQKLRGEDQPGLSVFYKDSEGKIYHTYSSYERGPELLIGTYMVLDLMPKGRNEEEIMDWMTYHDAYPKGKPLTA